MTAITCTGEDCDRNGHEPWDCPSLLTTLCGGSRCPTHLHYRRGLGICSMCGRPVVTHGDGTAYEHSRPDVLGMIARGEYDGPLDSGRSAP